MYWREDLFTGCPGGTGLSLQGEIDLCGLCVCVQGVGTGYVVSGYV